MEFQKGKGKGNETRPSPPHESTGLSASLPRHGYTKICPHSNSRVDCSEFRFEKSQPGSPTTPREISTPMSAVTTRARASPYIHRARALTPPHHFHHQKNRPNHVVLRSSHTILRSGLSNPA